MDDGTAGRTVDVRPIKPGQGREWRPGEASERVPIERVEDEVHEVSEQCHWEQQQVE